MDCTLLKLPEVLAMTRLKRSTVYSEMLAGRFPRPIKISKRAVAWVEADIQKWIDGKAGK